MIITEAKLKRMIREVLRKRRILKEESSYTDYLPDFAKNALEDIASLFSTNKNIKAGESLTWAGTNSSVTTLCPPAKEPGSGDFYVLCVWDADSGKPEDAVEGGKVKNSAWGFDRFGIFHGGRYDADHKAIILSKKWLEAAGNKNVTDKMIEKLKKKWDEDKIAAVKTTFLQSAREFEKETYKGGNLKDFALDTVVPTVAAAGELLAIYAATNPVTLPAAAALKGVSDTANLLDAYRKLETADFLGCALALIGLLPAAGDSITVIGNGVKKLGAEVGEAFGKSKAGKALLSELIELLGSIIDGDLVDSFKNVAVAFANERDITADDFVANLRDALTTFKGTLARFVTGDDADFGHAVAVAHGDVAKAGLASTKSSKSPIPKGFKPPPIKTRTIASYKATQKK